MTLHSRRAGGPTSQAGKAISRLNATKHGALSEVIPEHEVPAYTHHLDRVRDHFQPIGYLEEVLTERVANLLWRIGRVARYEQAVIKRHVESALHRDGITSLQDLINDLGELARSADPHAEEYLNDARAYVQQLVAAASLPADVVDKVPRYEAHLDRALQRTIAQLNELRTHRGEFVSQSRTGQETTPGDGREHA